MDMGQRQVVIEADLFLGQRVAFGQLQVVLGLGGLVPGGDSTVGPVGGFQGLANALHFLTREQAGNMQQHEHYLRAERR